MTAYELGILAAQRSNVPGHLKQAYARGFAGVMEKRAGAGAAEMTKMMLPVLLGGLAGTAAGVGVPMAFGEKPNIVTTMGGVGLGTVIGQLYAYRRLKQRARAQLETLRQRRRENTLNDQDKRNLEYLESVSSELH